MARLPNHDDVVTRWLDVLEGRRSPCGRTLDNYRSSALNIYGEGPVLYSYGSHFRLAEYWPAGRHGRDRALFLLNGDRVSVTTSRHQSATQGGVGRRAAGFGADVLILPFSALEGARIVRESIRPLEIRPDRWTETLEPIGDVDVGDIATATSYADRDGYQCRTRVYTWRLGDGRRIERSETLERTDVDYSMRDENGHGRRTVRTFEPGADVGEPRLMSTPTATWGLEMRLEPDGRWYGVRRRHWLGDSVFVADVATTVRRRRSVMVRDVIRATLEDLSADRFAVRNGRDRPRLLSALTALDTSAPIVETASTFRRRRFISSFDNGEPRELYYLATLPGSSRARTVADAELDLAPAAVHAAIARGRDVRRQGDVFFIATSLSDGELEGITRARARLTQWTRGARARRGEIGYAAPLDSAGRARRARWIRRRFAETLAVGTSGPRTPAGTRPDVRKRRRENETRRLELAAAMRSAILQGDSWRAKRTRHAMDQNRSARRKLEGQRIAHRDAYRGRIGLPYAVETWRAAQDEAMDRFEPGARPLSPRWHRNRARIAETLAVHGTAHTASEVVRATFGRVYVRGTVRHVPDLLGERRQRDHVNLRLGDGATWYLAVRNTVPRLRDGR